MTKPNKNKKDCYNCNPEKFKNIQKGETVPICDECFRKHRGDKPNNKIINNLK